MLNFRDLVKRTIFSYFANGIEKSNQQTLACVLQDSNPFMYENNGTSMSIFSSKQLIGTTAYIAGMLEPERHTPTKKIVSISIYADDGRLISSTDDSYLAEMRETFDRLTDLSFEKNTDSAVHFQTILNQGLVGPDSEKFHQLSPALDDCPPLLDPVQQPQRCPTIKI